MSISARIQGDTRAVRIGAVFGILIGIACTVYGATTFVGDRPLPYTFGFLLGGIIQCVACAFTLRNSRIAWAFAVSLTATGAFVFLFGIPKIRDGLGVATAVAVVPFFAFSLAAVLLTATKESAGADGRVETR